MPARRRRARLLVLLAGLAVVLVTGVGYAAVRTTSPTLRSGGPTSVTGTDATAVFDVAGREIRQVRYRDQATLDYRFRLINDGSLPITVSGIDPKQRNARLFGFVALEDRKGHRTFTVPAHGSSVVHLLLHMGGCESLSARAGSFASSVLVRTERVGIDAGSVLVELPEEIHTGSPREAFCPNSTAKSRPPG